MSEEKKFPSDLADRFQLRMPPGMRDRIAKEAEKNGRSMNAEIISVLEDHYPAAPTLEDTKELLRFLIEMSKMSKAPKMISGIYDDLMYLKAILEEEAESRPQKGPKKKPKPSDTEG